MNYRVSWFLAALPIAIALSPQPLSAQSIISGDSRTSIELSPDGKTHNITGGHRSGDNHNLFHTFQEFGLNQGEIADFIADPAIANILGRVIGGNPSIIDGLIRISQGNPNLFLMNPAGIIFGANASLNVPGDFTATTATGIGFGEDRWFNAFGTIDDEEYGNLTGNPSEFAFDLANPSAIINLTELTVNHGNLTLLAGMVASTGNLSASNGNLVVAAVPGSSLVRISQPGYLLSLEIETPREVTGIEWLQLPELLTGSESVENLLASVDLDPSQFATGNVWGQAGTGQEILVYADRDLILADTWKTARLEGDAGNIAFQAGQNIELASLDTSSGGGNGGSVSLVAGEGIFVNGRIDTSSFYNDAGEIALFANGEIATGDLTARSWGHGNGGAIALTSQWGSIWTQAINTSSEGGSGGNISFLAEGSLLTGDITTSSEEQNGGDIWLFSISDSIDTGFLDSSSEQGDGGNVDLVASGDIAITALNAEGADFGGRVHISTQSYFRATEGFIARDNLFASISTIGNWASGDIAIYHGGDGGIAFEVGYAGINGTAGTITTGDATILPYQSFASDVREGNITIGTDDPFYDPANDDLTPEEIDPIAMEREIPEDEENIEFEENLSEEFDLFVENAESPREELVGEIEESIEEHFTEEFATHLRVGHVERVTPQQAQQRLRDIERQTGIKPALVYAIFTADESAESSLKTARKEDGKLLWQSPQNTNSSHQNFLPKRETQQQSDRLELVVVTAEGGITRKPLNVTRKQVLDTVREYRRSVTNLRRPNAYRQSARELYQFLIAPIESHLQAQGINNLSFIMDEGLRAIPLAALHDGNQFAIEKYSLGMMPSLSLTDMNYRDLRDRQILAMGAEKFVSQSPLPAVPVELTMITETLWQGKAYLNEEFTLDNFHAAREKGHYNIVHLATHGEFKAGAPGNSYIQFWDRKLALDRLQELKLSDPQVDLLVLSACRTALGDAQAELGFSGLAVMAGVKSALGSLWYVNDEGTLAFMSQFYERLQSNSTKAEALRQAQLAMLRGNIRIEGGQLMTPLGGVDLPPELEGMGDLNLAHPYYWSAFTLIGNPW